GHPYFPLAGKGAKRTFTEGQKERTVSYWHSGLGGDSVKKYARECGLFPSTMHEWIDEVGGSSSSGLPGGRGSPNSECGSSLHDVEQLRPTSAEKDISTRLAERMDGTPPLKRRKREGTAIWLDDRFGGPPLRFASLPKGKRRRYTEEERGAVVDYAVEQREMKTIGECTKEIGVGAGCISKWLREACEAYQAFSESDLNDTLRVIDCRKLLPDLRAGKTSLCVSDYTGGEKYSNGKRGQKLKGVRAREEDRDGRLYFASPEKGELRVFAKDQKERAVDYWLGEFEGDSISNCAKELNLHADTLIGWVGGGGRGRKRRSLHTTESPGNSPEATDSDPDEVSLPDIPVEDVNRLLPIEPS
ncbi:MAG: hypothetical protein OXF02_05160, partial [Simkaniaceae bacterium]|nr:hypothetical protein [Simkaniaceae bacterium]